MMADAGVTAGNSGFVAPQFFFSGREEAGEIVFADESRVVEIG